MARKKVRQQLWALAMPNDVKAHRAAIYAAKIGYKTIHTSEIEHAARFSSRELAIAFAPMLGVEGLKPVNVSTKEERVRDRWKRPDRDKRPPYFKKT